MKVTVVGAGAWGFALAAVFGENPQLDVWLWGRDMSHVNLSGTVLPKTVTITDDMVAAVVNATIVLLAIPTHSIAAVAASCAPSLSDTAIIVSGAKGFDTVTGETMSPILTRILPNNPICALSGPNIANEITIGLPAAAVIASENSDAATTVRNACTSTRFRLYSSSDLRGVEYAGGLKNIVAIAAGICDGLHVGDNGKAAVMTRGIAEMTRLGVQAGAKPETFAGLAGLGDCIVTCTSQYSRNRKFGESLAQGNSVEQTLDALTTVEGVSAVKATQILAQRFDVEMPIADQLHKIIFVGKPLRTAIDELLHREPVSE